MKYFTALILNLYIPLILSGQTLSRFSNVSAVDEVTFIESAGVNSAYVGSSGGLVIFHPIDGNYDILNGGQDLLDLNITAGLKLNEQYFILGTYGGYLYLLDTEKSAIVVSEKSLAGNPINAFSVKGDTLWVACRNMLAVYLVNDQQLQFADFFANFPSDFTELSAVFSSGGKVWLGAENCLLKAPSDFGTFNLKDQSLWEQVPLNGSLTPTVKDLCGKGDTTFVASTSGLFLLTEGAEQRFFSGATTALFEWQDKLYWSFYNRVLTGNFYHPDSVLVLDSNIKDFIIVEGEAVAITRSEGIYLENSDSVINKKFSLIPSNVSGEIVANEHGEYYIANSPLPLNRSDGLYKWNGDFSERFYWSGTEESDWHRMNMARNVKEMVPGQFLVCTWGGGFWINDENQNTVYYMNTHTDELELHIQSFDGEGYKDELFPADRIVKLPNILQNVPGYDNYAIVPYAIKDDYNNFVWISQWMADNIVIGFPVMEGKVDWSDTSSVVYIQPPIGFSDKINTLEADMFGNLWIGSDDAGCAYINIPDLLNGDIKWKIIDENDYLTSNDVRYIKCDLDGYVWIGTASGINVWTGQILYTGREYSQPIGLVIEYIFIDRAGNRWFATDQGISMLKYYSTPWYSDNNWVHYVSSLTPYDEVRPGVEFVNLPQSEIKSVFIDEEKELVLVGSYSGLYYSDMLSALPSYAKEPDIIAFPNPVKFGTKHRVVYFKNVVPGAGIKILTVSGRLIKELQYDNSLDFQGSWGVWDGTDSSGKMVPSGVYLFYAYTEEGGVSGGKIFVINDQ